MKVIVKNFGVIKTASLDLEKQLILFCGGNSTGKTYLSYLVYAILSQKYAATYLSVKDKESIVEKDGFFVIRLKGEQLWDYKNKMLEYIRMSLDELFGMPMEDAEKLFSSLYIQLDTTEQECRAKIEQWNFDRKFDNSLGSFQAIKYSGTDEVLVRPNGLLSASTLYRERFLAPFFYMLLTNWPIASVHIFPVERNSIYTFSKELSISRNALIDQMQKLPKDKNLDPFKILESGSKRYPRAVSDGIVTANDLTTLRKTPGPYYALACRLEQELLNGTLSVGQEGDVEFLVGSKKRRRHLPIHMSASLIKTMASFFFTLKYQAKENDMFIIDEPEMNMHPDTQVVFVAFIVRLLNEGLRFLISTHSDYIIRELNYYIVKNRIDGEGIDAERVNAYYFQPGKDGKVNVQRLLLNKYGIGVPSIDAVIDDQNERFALLLEKELGRDE